LNYASFPILGVEYYSEGGFSIPIRERFVANLNGFFESDESVVALAVQHTKPLGYFKNID